MKNNHYFAAIIIFSSVLTILAGCKQDVKDVNEKKKQEFMNQHPQAAKPAPDAPSVELGENNSLNIGPLTSTVPADWKPVVPSSKMRAAQFILKSLGGENEIAELAVFYFGPGAGGIEANLQRWYAQFEQPDGKSTAEVVEKEEFESNGLKIIMVYFTGTVRGGGMPGTQSSASKENWMNLSAIVETEQGPWFFKATGPEATLKSHINNMKSFVRSLRRSDQVIK